MSFLDKVVAAKRREIALLETNPPAVSLRPRSTFKEALSRPGLSVIAEIKRRSPSKGPIAPDLDASATASAYADGGAAAISCLTDREFFGAEVGDLPLALTAGLPVLRKDFIIDELQIDEAVALGASAVLLIVRILNQRRLEELLRHARLRNLDTLVEVHEETELARALSAGAEIVGVNNRDLDTLVVDPHLASRLRPFIPSSVVCVSESGVKTRADVVLVEEAGFDAVLIGETLARSQDPAAKLRELTGASEASR